MEMKRAEKHLEMHPFSGIYVHWAAAVMHVSSKNLQLTLTYDSWTVKGRWPDAVIYLQGSKAFSSSAHYIFLLYSYLNNEYKVKQLQLVPSIFIIL